MRYVPRKKSWKSLYHNKERWEDPLSRPAPFCGERFRFRAIRIAAVNARNDGGTVATALDKALLHVAAEPLANAPLHTMT